MTHHKVVEIESAYIAPKKDFWVNHSTIVNSQFECFTYFQHFKKQILIEDNANDNKNSVRFGTIATDDQWKKFLPITYRFSVPNHSAGRVDAQHWGIRNSIQIFFGKEVEKNKDFMIPESLEDLLKLLNSNLQKPISKNGVVKFRRFLPLVNDIWQPLDDKERKNHFNFLSEKNGRKFSLMGIKKAYQIEVSEDKVNLFDQYDSDSIFEKYQINKIDFSEDDDSSKSDLDSNTSQISETQKNNYPQTRSRAKRI